MYRCERCAQVTSPGIPAHTLVVETRRHTHPVRPHAQTEPADPKRRKKRTARRHKVTDPGGVGPQIVRTLTVCPTCHGPAGDPPAE